MAPPQPTAGWKKLYNRFYQKRQLYKMKWKVNLDTSGIEGATFGGPVALTTGHAKSQMIQLFSSDGMEIGSFLWDKAKLVKMGWTLKEELVLVLEDGMVMLYSIFGELINQFSLGLQDGRKVAECHIWGTGLVVMTTYFQFVAVESFEDPLPFPLKESQLDSPPCSWMVIEPRFTPHGGAEVLAATTGGTIIVITRDRAEDQYLSNGPFSKMALSPRGNMLACFAQNGAVWVTPPTFQGKHYTFNTKSQYPPLQMVWCGGDTVVCTWRIKDNERLLLVVGPHDSWIRYTYNEPIIMIPECDGVRIISQSNCEFLQLVDDVTEEIFKVGSEESAAVLFDATQHFVNKSPKADELIRRIAQKKELAIAVKKCITAAAYEFEPAMQTQLLQAASFGKCFVDFYNPDYFVDTCRTLRVLNAVRFHGVGMPITYEQYQMLSPRVLVDRLVSRHHHLMAKCICSYLSIKPDRILVHWACAKVKADLPDEQLLRVIVSKLSDVPGISYAEVACAAYKIRKPDLATKLLDYEPRAADQVPLLLSMHYDTLALSKAIESGDTDLMYLVLLHIKRNKSVEEFVHIISEQRQALTLFILYCKEQDIKLLKDVYHRTGQAFQLAKIAAIDALNLPDSEPSKVKAVQLASKEFAKIREKSFEAKVIEDQARLMHFQKALEAELQQPFVGKSVTDTVFRLLQLEQTKKAANLQKDFKIPDARFWWCKIRALASTGQWDRLFAFSKDKKSPIGYAPFAEICMKYHAPVEAAKYVPRIDHPGIKAEFLMKLGAYKEAAMIVAKEIKDPNLLLAIRKEAVKDDPAAVAVIDQLLQKFQ